MSNKHPTLTMTYAERATHATHPLTNYLFRLMDLKASNLCLSADVQTARELLYLADKVGPSIVVLKTHYDLISGWDYNPQTGTGAKLAALARKHGFLIFEDRKFVDIGKTVQMQYTAGTARIIEWAHITNANIDAGKDMVRAMAEAAQRWKDRINYEVKTSVSVGTPVSEGFDESGDRLDPREQLNGTHAQANRDRDGDGRKGSIVSVTTVTQSFEPADSPRLSKSMAEGDDVLYPGIEEAPMDRGLLLLAQMSSKGCLMTKDYTQACVEAARENKSFVMGFVSQQALNTEPDDHFIHMTPGCKLPPPGEEENGAGLEGDGLGQQYNTPAKLINICGTDIVIVGRGILSAGDPPSEAERCDRQRPCTNCISRNRQDTCTYSPSSSKSPASPPAKRSMSENGGNTDAAAQRMPIMPAKVVNFGYSQTGASTLGFLQRIESASSNHQESSASPMSRLPGQQNEGGDHFTMRERYKSLIRQLPEKTFIDRLVDVFFVEINWQYYGLDRDVFDRQMAEWHALPFKLLNAGGPQALPPDLRAFPGLLFQVLAIALLVLPCGNTGSPTEHARKNGDPDFQKLKYARDMTFEDLAVDYSESGMAILSLLGKRQMSVTTVLAGFLRASFLKYVALVTEAWHAIGSTIRDAQEIGLHRDSLDPKPSDPDDAGAVLENQWEIQRRRKLWMILVGWDVHTGAVLGRPTTINYTFGGPNHQPSLPIDAPIPKCRSKTPVTTREEDGPPTPLTRALWAYQIMCPLRDILELEKEGPCPKDFSKVDQLHQRLLELEAQTPPYFRLENPDMRFDELPGCYWIPYVRATLPQLMAFNLMALHRPYIFTRRKSRTEALKASLDMLHSQRLHFQSLKPQQYKTFSLFFGTFDAIVLMAAIFVLFPKEHRDLVQSALQHFTWAVERFEAMSDRNKLAKAALGVLQAIYVRLKKTLGISCSSAKAMLLNSAPTTTTGSSYGGGNSPFSFADPPSTAAVMGDSFLNNLANGGGGGGGMGGSSDGGGGNGGGGEAGGAFELGDWNLPGNFNWANLQPIYATSDLIYNDLVGNPDHLSSNDGDNTATMSMGNNNNDMSGTQQQQSQLPWQFAGDFGSDSVWNLLNQFTP
ncbi:OMPdecase-domain-containing protein, partial [Diplogelasinospora grovesii]